MKSHTPISLTEILALSELRKRVRSRLLLSLFLAWARSLAECFSADQNTGRKPFVMIRPALSDKLVGNRHVPILLHVLLQGSFIVAPHLCGLHISNLRYKLRAYIISCRFPSAVKINGADDCLEYIFKVVLPIGTAAAQLSMPETQMPPQMQPTRKPRKRIALHKACAHLGQLPLAALWKVLI